MFYREGSRLNKGYCHLYTGQEAYDAILGRPHFLADRALFTTPYISGRRLERQNEANNARRIVVRNLPQWYTEADLKRAFSRFGRVEVAYVFCTHFKLRETGDTLPPTGSIQFADSSLALKMIRIRNVEVQAGDKPHFLVVYPFIHNYNDIKDSLQMDRKLEQEEDRSPSDSKDLKQEANYHSAPLPVISDSPVANPHSDYDSKGRIARKRVLELIHKYRPSRRYYHLLKNKFHFRTHTDGPYDDENMRFNRSVFPRYLSSEGMHYSVQVREHDAPGISSLALVDIPERTEHKFWDEEHLLFPADASQKFLSDAWTERRQENWPPLEPIADLRAYFSNEKTVDSGFGGESTYGHCPDRDLFLQLPPQYSAGYQSLAWV